MRTVRVEHLLELHGGFDFEADFVVILIFHCDLNSERGLDGGSDRRRRLPIVCVSNLTMREWTSSATSRIEVQQEQSENPRAE